MNAQKSIVVLPFHNLSSDPENEYFADGVTEEIISALSTIEGLKVTARTSAFAYKHRPKDIRLVGEELGVSTALEGSVRKAGNRIRITAQLIRTDDGFHVWSETFDRELTDIFELQDEISLLIADKIREDFGHLEIADHLVAVQTRSIDAYSCFMRGRFYHLRWNVDDFTKATREYEKSISLDPGFYQPYFGLVQCYGLMSSWGFVDREEALRKASYFLERGLEINDSSSVAHFARATRSLWIEWKPYEALGHLRRAVTVNPNDSESLEAAAESHIALGQFDEASSCISKALEINPLSANHHFTLGNIYYLQEQFPKALACFDRSLQIDPSWDFSLQVSACCHVLMGNREALDALLSQHPDLKDGYLFSRLYDAIHRGKAINTLDAPEPSDVYFPWSLWTLIYAGNEEQAFHRLVAGTRKKLGQYLNFQHEPLNKPLRSLDAYSALVQSVFDEPQRDDRHDSRSTSTALIPDEDLGLYIGKLEHLMQEQHLYASESLTLRDLALELDLTANKLSWLLNAGLGKNFNEYVNGLRVEDFKRKSLDPAYRHYTLLSIAYESGFNSKSVFNGFFKSSEGMTPSAWVKAHRA